jgi:hypothetical protein
MPVHIDEMTTDVSAETPESPQAVAPAPDWQEVWKLRELHARALRDALRTRAEGFDD